MNKQKGSAQNIIIVVLAVLVIGALGYLVFTKKSAQNNSPPPQQVMVYTYKLEGTSHHTLVRYDAQGNREVLVEDINQQAVASGIAQIEPPDSDNPGQITPIMTELSFPSRGSKLYFSALSIVGDPNWPYGIFEYDIFTKHFRELAVSKSYSSRAYGQPVISSGGLKIAINNFESIIESKRYVDHEHMQIFDLVKDKVTSSPLLPTDETLFTQENCDYECKTNVQWLSPDTISYGVYKKTNVDQNQTNVVQNQFIEIRQMKAE